MKIVEKNLWKFLETFLYLHNLKNVGPGGVSIGATLPLFQYGPKYICVPTRRMGGSRGICDNKFLVEQKICFQMI